MSTVIDFHSHILPGIDDGSPSMEMSVAMLRMEAEQGVTHVVATPHFYAQQDTPDRFLARRAEAEARLRDAMASNEGFPKILVGAEVYYFPGIGESDRIFDLTIAGKSCILLEMPDYTWTTSMYRDLENLYARGLTPVLAHIDRYVGPCRNWDILKRLEQLPVAVQANASFFLRRSTATMAKRLLKNNKIHLLGSDCHNMTTRKPNLGDAMDRIRHRLGEEAILRVEEHGRTLLDL